jgi:hypothetical protein
MKPFFNKAGVPIFSAVMMFILVSAALTALVAPVVQADVEESEHGGGSSCYDCHVDNYPDGS